MALFGHGGEVPPDAAEGNRTRLRAEGPRDVLLHFNHAQILFRTIIGERHSEIVQEEQEGVSIPKKPIQEILGFGWLDSSPLVRPGRRWGLSSQPSLDQLMRGSGELLNHRGRQTGLSPGTRLFDREVAGQQMLFELACPGLVLVFLQKAQLPKGMGIALSMLTVALLRRAAVAVVLHDPMKLR